MAKEFKFTANQVYKIIKPFDLTTEQESAVQEASTDSPSLIVAGAGSGKTELMAVRVLWLVANGFAKPKEILGLTFTRKAAAELSKRIYDSLLKLRDSDLWPEDLEYDFEPPTISTYNAYANNIFRDNALSIGYEPEATLLTEAAAFQLAREVVVKNGSSIDSRISEVDSSLNSIVEAVLALAQAMNDNLVGSEEIENYINGAVSEIANLPQKPGSTNYSPFGYITNILQPLLVTPVIAKLADAFRDEKKVQGFVDYSDQVAFAEYAVREVPQVRQLERSKYSQILLDEYQDTSFLQTRLLQHLFSKASVFAVGDPNQAIYGWRGASASNLSSFHNDFEAQPGSQAFKLSTSWRNPQNVLSLANHLIDSLKVVELRPAKRASAGIVDIKFVQDQEDEARVTAEWFKNQMSGEKTGALLMRKRSSMPIFVEALESAGVSVEVVGLGGLLEMPEIVDLVSALKVIHDPSSGSALIRLLAGPRWRIGAKDLERLHHYAGRKSRLNAELRERAEESLAPEDSLSIVDALDLILDEKEPETIGLSELGLARMRDAASLLRSMRRQTGLGLVEFVRSVEQDLWLDIEVQANPRRKNPLAHLNAFASIVSGYSSSNLAPHLGGFLKWLEFADEREKFEVPSSNPERGTVQVLTIHAAKGLEWDNVAVANLVEGDFPSTGKGSSGWLSAGRLPFPLRGDYASLPHWNFTGLESQGALKASVDEFKEAMRSHLLKEELRLMYVAVTRPRENLMLTGSYWKPGNQNSRTPSSYLTSAAEFRNETISELESQANPLLSNSKTQTWPLEPLGHRHRKNLEVSASKTISVQASLQSELASLDLGDEIQSDITLLLGEVDERMAALNSTSLPVRIPASSFKDFIGDFASTSQRLRRPMPQPPFKQTRSGTLFHEWVESMYASSSKKLQKLENDNYEFELREFDEGEFETSGEDSGKSTERSTERSIANSIEQLKTNFANSRFANMEPLEVELEIQFTSGANTFICKLDAVFKTPTGVLIVDWKTGKSPKTKEDTNLKALQLALYRLAYSKFSGIPPENIEVCFYFVSEGLEITPEQIPGELQLMALWDEVPKN